MLLAIVNGIQFKLLGMLFSWHNEYLLVLYNIFRGKNKDVVGFVEIPGTIISYPVMQTKDNPDYYLNHDINKDYSSYGIPYLSAYCDIKTSDQLINIAM